MERKIQAYVKSEELKDHHVGTVAVENPKLSVRQK
jgi:hypothetical protein